MSDLRGLRKDLKKLVQRWGWLDDEEVEPAIDDVLALFTAQLADQKQRFVEIVEKQLEGKYDLLTPLGEPAISKHQLNKELAQLNKEGS